MPALGARFNIRSIPTLALFKGGREVARQAGAMGAGDMVSVYIRHILVQSQTPDAIRGRVSAVSAVFIGASNELGEFESGTLAAVVGTVPAVVAGGLGTLLVAALWARWFPALRNRDRLAGDVPLTPT